MVMQTKLPQLTCLRCGHVWIPRIEPSRVVRCPACSNPRWNESKTI